MKAAVLYGREDVRIEDVPEPSLKPGEVRVAIEAALTCGTDLKVFKRGYHAKMIVPPAVFGHEFAGVISEVGSPPDDASAGQPFDWRAGERVVAANSAPCGRCRFCRGAQENLCDHLVFLNGAYAESIVVPARIVEKNLLRLKPGTAFRDAALMEPLACVMHGAEEARLRKGQRLLVIGAGPIGLMFDAVAAHRGCDVIVAGRGEQRLAIARRLGATSIIDVSGRELVAAVRAENPEPADVVIEAVGKPETWQAAVQLVRKGGLVNFFGGCPSGTTVSLDTGLLHYSGLTLVASFHHTPRAVRQALDLIESGVIRADAFVDAACPLSRLPELFHSMSRGNRAVKTLIRVGE